MTKDSSKKPFTLNWSVYGAIHVKAKNQEEAEANTKRISLQTLLSTGDSDYTLDAYVDEDHAEEASTEQIKTMPANDSLIELIGE